MSTQVMKPSEYLKYAAAAALIIFVITTSWKQMAATARAMEETITRVMDRTLNESVKKASRAVLKSRRRRDGACTMAWRFYVGMNSPVDVHTGTRN